MDLVTLRGHLQSVHLYGVTHARPVIVSSGDGGWIHVGPHVAQLLAAHGYFVVGFDVRAYLSGFTLAAVWESRYLVYPGGLALLGIAADVSALVSGGYRRIFTK